MAQLDVGTPSFNLWTEPWITVERPGGQLDVLNIQQTLMEAPNIRALYEPSPLVVVAVHRLLVAVLQDSLRPERVADLVKIWRDGQFSAEALQCFDDTYAARFDLFSAAAPFLQSADLPLVADKKDGPKPIGYLLTEQPAGTAVTHYTHAYDAEQQFCSRCVAKGLLLIPAFASSGGSGIKPSINGVPPIYVLPGGETLFTSLAASLTLPNFQPGRAEGDAAWWSRSPIVKKKEIVKRVGYLHSLTFPARRVRVHPVVGQRPCTRCGQQTAWHAATMIYEMGQSRPEDAVWWRDPFAAYRKPKTANEEPLPIRPVEGRPVWREFSGLFLPSQPDETKLHAYRPSILEQLEELPEEVFPFKGSIIPLRVISLRTDMKMKIFEWEESGFAVPPRLLREVDTAKQIEESLEFAVKCAGILKGTFKDYFGGGGKDKNRLKSINVHMETRYWQALGQTFRAHIQRYTSQANTAALFEDWLQLVIRQAIDTFEEASKLLPDDGAGLALRVQANSHCQAKLYSYRKKTYPMEERQ